METVLHELATGKDCELSRLLSIWNERCEKQYESLRSELYPSFTDTEPSVRRPNSADQREAPLSDLDEQFDAVLKLRATLAVEVDALQQLRAELEDSQSMSEVHIQLERASMENRRLRASLRVAHEQISDLYFNKRVLEAEMVAIRSDRDRQVTEAKERARIAERAVLAATSRGRFGTTVHAHLNNPDSVQANNNAVSASNPRTDDCPVLRLPFLGETQAAPSALCKPKAKDFSRFKRYTTLTGLTFDEFDSLDEDEPSDPELSNANLHPNDSPSEPAAHLQLVSSDYNQSHIPKNDSTSTTSETAIELPTVDTQFCVFSKPSFSTEDVKTPISKVTNDTGGPLSPRSSSTPRKSENHTNPIPYSQTPPLDVESIVPLPTLLIPDTETVPKSEYLNLLDEIKELRHQLDCAQRIRPLDDEYSVPMQLEVTNIISELQHTVSGSCGVSQEKDGRLSELLPVGLLPPSVPGSTRIFDWSVSLNHSDTALLSNCEEAEEQSPEYSPELICRCCLQLQAKLLVSEILADVAMTDLSDTSNEKIVTLQAQIKRLELKCENTIEQPSAQSAALTQLSREVDGLITILNSTEFGQCLQHIDLLQLVGVTDSSHSPLTSSIETLFPPDKLPVDIQNLVATVCRAIETERGQLQKAFEQRISHFERNHTFSLTELEVSRRDLLEQLARSEATNAQLKDELLVLQQRLSAKDRFLSEQTDEREVEREEFRIELARLEKQLKAAKSEVLSCKLINGCTDQVVTSSSFHDDRDSFWGAYPNSLQYVGSDAFPPCLFQSTITKPQNADSESRFGHDGSFSTPDKSCQLLTCDEELPFWGNAPPNTGACEQPGVSLAVELFRTLPSYLDKETETAELIFPSPEFTHPSGTLKADACIDTADLSQSFSEEKLETVTTKTTRTLNANAAVALLGQLTLVEESTMVTQSQPNGARANRFGKCNRQNTIPMIDEAISTSGLSIIPSLGLNSTQFSRCGRFFSSPCLHFEFPMSVVEDTGIEMSHGLSAFDGVEITSTGAPDSPMSSSTANSSNLQVKCTVFATPSEACPSKPIAVPSAAITSSPNAAQSLALDKRDSFDSTGLPIPIGITETDAIPQQDLSSVPTLALTEMKNAISSTEDLHLEFLPSTELAALIEGNATSNVVLSALRCEIDNLVKYQDELQADYNLVQEMLDERDNELERCTRENLALQTRCVELERQIDERKNTILERDEDLFLLAEENKTIKIRIAELEELQVRASPTMTRRNVEIQTEASVKSDDESAACSSSITLDTCNTVLVDTGLSSASADLTTPAVLHNVNDRGAFSLSTSRNIWTSTPVDQSDASGVDSDFQGELAFSRELQTLAERLRTESLKLLSISAACQPIAELTYPTAHQPESTTVPNIQEDESAVCEHSQPSVLFDLIRANTSLKAALNHLAQVVERYEAPPSAPSCLELHSWTSADDVHKLIKCFAYALSADESTWIAMLTRSVTQTTTAFPTLLSPLKATRSPVAFQSMLEVVDRLVNGFISFVQQEDKYRNCLVHAHLIERRCLTAELNAATIRSNSLAVDVARMSERLDSHKEALARADSLNLRLANQVSNLKTDLACATSDLEAERLESEKRQNEIVHLNSRLLEESRRAAALAARTESMKSDALRLEEELKRTTDKLMETEKSFAQRIWSTETVERLHDAQKYQRTLCDINSSVAPVARADARPSAENHDSSIRINHRSTSSQNDLRQVLASVASHLAIARRDAIAAERGARELQATNNALRLILAETELRLTPLLFSVTGGSSPFKNMNKSTCQQTVLERPISSSHCPPVTRFTELRSVCTQLLSIASAEEKQSDQPLTSDDNSSVYLSHENLPTTSRAVSFDPMISLVHSNSSELFSQVKNITQTIAERNLETLKSETLLRLPLNASKEEDSPNSFQASTDLTSPLREPYRSQTSQPTPSSEETVSLERFIKVRARYLRSESYRRALAFQKRYLILLLGRFQLPEEVVVASLGRPEPVHYDYRTGFPNPNICVPLRRFRTAVRTVQVIFRMRLMLGRWGRSGVISTSPSVVCSHTAQLQAPSQLKKERFPVVQSKFRLSTSSRLN